MGSNQSFSSSGTLRLTVYIKLFLLFYLQNHTVTLNMPDKFIRGFSTPKISKLFLLSDIKTI